MQLFFIRHGETEHNRAGLLAGVTDSKLTNHGVLQTQRLAKYLVKDRKLNFTHVFASDLTRAFMTADEIRKCHNESRKVLEQIEVVTLELLREQDFGSFELVAWSSKRDSDASNTSIPKTTDVDFKPKETPESLTGRAQMFLDDFIMPLLALDDIGDLCVAVVYHGIFLSSLWKSLLKRFDPSKIRLSPELQDANGGRPLQHLGGWSNTGFLELDLKRQTVCPKSPVSKDEAADVEDPSNIVTLGTITTIIKMINGKQHLLNFKRARGGLGSMTFDKRQKQVDGYFKTSKRSKPSAQPKPTVDP